MNIQRNTNIEDLAWIDQFADKFELAWNGSSRPDIESFLAKAGSNLSGSSHDRLIAELIKVDFEYRLRSGEAPSPDEYLQRFPQLKESGDDLLDDLIRELDQLVTQFDPNRKSSTGVSHHHKEDLAISPDDVTVESNHSVTKPAPKRDSEIPQVMGRFRLMERVGEGAFGIVYKAKDVQLNRIVAIKIPRMDRMSSQPMAQRFIDEARAAAKMNHPGILKIFDISFYEDTPLLVSEFLEGASISEHFAEKRSFSARESAELVLQIAEALHYAHRSGLIHRDIKPSNIFLCPDDQPVILDFGIAHSERLESLTATGQILGTPAYMSPEQASGKSNLVDARSDVYSLGVLLYEFLTGEQPFRGSPHRLIHQVLNDEPKHPSHYQSGVPADLETICLKAMEKSPSLRYSSASAMADDLRRFLENKPIQARPISKAGRIARWCRRNPRVAALSSLLVFGLIVTTVGATITSFVMSDLANKERSARHEAQIQSSRDAAEEGIVKLQNGNALGLLDIVRSFETVTDHPDELRSRQLLADRWVREFEDRLLTLVSFEQPVISGEFSPDGRIFATCCADQTIRMWDTVTGTQIGSDLGVPGLQTALSVSFSPEGRYLVSGERLTELVIWDLTQSGYPREVFELAGNCLDLAFNENEDVICVNHEIVDGRQKLQAWNANTGTLLVDLPPLAYRQVIVRISPDAQTMAVACGHTDVPEVGDASPQIIIIDLKTGTKTNIQTIGIRHRPDILRFSPDNTLIACGWRDGTVTVIDRQSKVIAELSHSEDVKDIAYSDDGRWIATASFDTNARIWDLSNMELPPKVLAHDGPVTTLDFNHDSDLLVTGGYDTVARMWSVESGELVAGSLNHQNAVTSVEFHPTENMVLTTSGDQTARIWQARQANEPLMELKHPYRVWSVDFSNDNQTLLSTSQEGSVNFWNMNDGTPVRPPIPVPWDLVSARFNPTDNTEIMFCNLNTIRFWDITKDEPTRETDHLQTAFRSCRFSSDGRFAVVGADTPCAWVFELSPGDFVARKVPHPERYPNNPVHDVAIHPNDQWFATGAADGFARVWDIETLEQVSQPLKHLERVEAIAFSPDGQLMATASRDLTIRFWTTADWKPFGRRIPLKTFVEEITFSPDSRMLVSTSHGGPVQIWDVQTGVAAGYPIGHDQFSSCAEFTSDGKLLATGSFDDTVRIWEMDLPGMTLDTESLKKRIWLALGARNDDHGNVFAIKGSEWNEYRKQLENQSRTYSNKASTSEPASN